MRNQYRAPLRDGRGVLGRRANAYLVAAPAPPSMSALHSANIGCTERGLVAMRRVVDVVRMYNPVLYEDTQNGVGGVTSDAYASLFLYDNG